MIFDKKSNAHLYHNGDTRLGRALKWLAETDIDALAEGKYEIESGGEIYVTVSDKETKPLNMSRLENHDNHIDIQYMIRGKEYMGFSPLENAGNKVSRDDNADITFYDGRNIDLVTLSSGYFIVIFPHDAHAPRIAVDQPEKTKKAVFKVLY